MKAALLPRLIALAFAASASALASAPPASPSPSQASLYQLDLAWTDDHGAAFRLAQLQGHPAVVVMFFTQCGSACPATVSRLKAIEAGLPAQARSRARFVLVSFDSDGDRPPVLARYRSAMGLGSDDWILLHGDADAVRQLSALLGVSYSRRGPGLFVHSSLVTLLDSSGAVVRQWSALEGAQESVIQAVARSP